MPSPVINHAKITPPTLAEAAIFCGNEKIPPPIIELTTIPARPKTPNLPLTICFFI